LLWGNASSRWVFSAQADAPEGVNALIAAFVAAASE
jgi:hypothetical protein